MAVYFYIAMEIKDTQGNILFDVPVTQSAVLTEELMKQYGITLGWNAVTADVLPVGAYIEHNGVRYSLLEPYSPTQKDEGTYEYSPVFHHPVMRWGKLPMFLYSGATQELDWSLTDNPANFMSAICDAIENETGEKWTYEVASDLAASASLSFSNTDILSGLNSIAGVFKTEWWFDYANKVIYLSKAGHGSAVTLEVGQNVGVPQVTQNKEGYYTRFYGFGSTRNIDQSYAGANVNSIVNRRLTLDPAKYPNGYIDIREGLTQEEVLSVPLVFDDIYPRSSLTISDVKVRMMWRLDDNSQKVQIGTDSEGNPVYDQYAIWYFKIPGFAFSKDLLISGKSLSAHFNSGSLNGREFELTYHDKGETLSNSDGMDFVVEAGDYEINFVEEGSYIIPAVTGLIPAEGDAVTLFNIIMPEEYKASAYAELEESVRERMAQQEEDRNNYSFESNKVAFYESNPNLSIGRLVTFVNGSNSISTRVIKLETQLDYPFEQRITVGNAIIKGSQQTLKEEVVNANQNIDLLAAINESTEAFQQALQRTQKLMQDAMAKIGDMWYLDPDNADTVRTRFNVAVDKAISFGGVGTPSENPGVTYLNNLLDVSAESPNVDDVLAWDGTYWANKKITTVLDIDAMWTALSAVDSSRIVDISHIPDLSSKYLSTSGGRMSGDITLPKGTYFREPTTAYAIFGVNTNDYLSVGSVDFTLNLRGKGNALYNNNTLIHSGNIGSYKAGDSDRLGGLRLGISGASTTWKTIPYVAGDGVMEIGKYIDFHNDNTSHDFSTRLLCTGKYSNNVNLPSVSGTLALLTSNVASASKLADNTAFTAWGQTFFQNGVPNNVTRPAIMQYLLFSDSDGGESGYIGRGGSNDVLYFVSYKDALIRIGRNNYNDLNIIGGKVGIGIISPAYRLDVAGTGRFTDALTIGTTPITEKTQNSTKYLEIDGNLVVTGAISFGGLGESTSSGGGINIEGLWQELTTPNTSRIIDATHIPDLSGKYLPLSGGTLTNSLVVSDGTISSTRTSTRRSIFYKNASTSVDYGTYIIDVSDSGDARLRLTYDSLTWKDNIVIHSGNVAPSLSAGSGNNTKITVGGVSSEYKIAYAQDCYDAQWAVSAGKLYGSGYTGINVGSSTQPVYFSDGVPVACTSYANASVNYANNAGLLGGQNSDWHRNNTIAFSDNRTSNTSFDVNVLLTGCVYNYDSTIYWKNAPSGMSYGRVLNLTSSRNSGAMIGQLAWDVNHASTTDTTRYLWWRTIQNANTAPYALWHQIAFIDSNVYYAQNLMHSNGTLGATVNSSGNVSIGYAGDGGAKLYVAGNIVATGALTFGSDERYKTKLSDVSVSLEDIANAPLFNYRWNDREDSKVHLGTTAQYWNKTAFRNAVCPNDEKLWTMSYSEIAMGNTIVLARELMPIKREVSKIKKLENRVSKLERILREHNINFD